MKAQERAGGPSSKAGDAKPKTATGEWEGQAAAVAAMGDEFLELEETTERSVAPVPSNQPTRNRAVETSDAYVPRERRQTVVSQIPAELAKSMGEIRDPSAPILLHHEVTRRVADSGKTDAKHNTDATPNRRKTEKHEGVDTYSVELVDEPNLPPVAQVAALVERARVGIQNGNLGAAVIAADQALVEAAKAPDPEMLELIKAARPFLDRIFGAYVGLLGEVPVRSRTDEQIAGQELGDRTRLLLAAVDGIQTLEQLARSTGMRPVEAMGIAASLLAAEIIRIKSK